MMERSSWIKLKVDLDVLCFLIMQLVWTSGHQDIMMLECFCVHVFFIPESSIKLTAPS